MLPRDAPHRELFKSGLKIDFRAQEKKLEQNASYDAYGPVRVKGQNSDFCMLGRRAAPAASAEGASMVGRAPQARGCSIIRRGKQQKRRKKRPARSACCEHCGPSAAGARMFDHPQE